MRAAAAATAFGRKFLRRNFPAAKDKIATVKLKLFFQSAAEIPVFAIEMKIPFSLPIFSRRQSPCTNSKDAGRRKFLSPRHEMNSTEDCPRASPSTRRIAAVPNARPASPRAQGREKFYHAERTQNQVSEKFHKVNAKRLVARRTQKLKTFSLRCLRVLRAISYFSEIQTKVPPGNKSKSGIKSASARWMQPCDAGRPRDF